MSSILKSSENFPNLLTYGFATHLLNLCAKEVMPNTLIKHIVELQKYFKNKHNAHGWLRAKGGLMPQIPNDAISSQKIVKPNEMQTLPKDFWDFFIKLHNCPPSSASTKRIFSTYDRVWNKIRNRLGAEKFEKLVKVYNFLKCESNDW